MADILILTASFGMGHKSVSNALKEQIEHIDENAEIVIADILEIVNPKVKDFSSKMYYKLTENYPLIYNTIYEIKGNNKNNIIDAAFCNLYYKKFYEYILTENPHAIISTFPLCSCMVSKIKEEYNADINLITVITDVVDSWEWIYDETNIYLVPTIEIKNKLIDKGINEDIIIVSGIPVKKEFLDNEEAPITKERNTILIVLSGIDSIPENLLYELNNNSNFKIKIVAGRNKKLYEELSNCKFSNILIYGYVDNLNQLMDESVFIVTKPGGVTLFEAINKELPLIVLNSNIGQEKGNIEFIRQKKIGIVIDNLKNLQNVLNYYISNHSIINYYYTNIRNVKNTIDYKKFIDSIFPEVI
jgi:processive 1,2-diacylglycerol beta-glucosyltransferase